jgi:peptidoglycan/LPS O-acetylase OafA/YrhL
MAQLEGWASNMTALADHVRFMPAGRHVYKPPYDIFLWTIPIEMKGSLYVFVLLLAFLRSRAVVRVGVVGALIIYLSRTTDLDMGLFLSGMLLAEATLFIAGRDKGSVSHQQCRSSPIRILVKVLAQVVIYAKFIIGFWMVGFPDEEAKDAYGFSRLHRLTPAAYNANPFVRQFFWHGLGAILLVSALVLCPMSTTTTTRSAAKSVYDSLPMTSSEEPSLTTSESNSTPSTQPLLRRPFNTPFAQYLGRISFSLYLVQGVVIKTLVAQYTTAAYTAFTRAESLAKLALNRDDTAKSTTAPTNMAAASNAATESLLRTAEYATHMADARHEYAWAQVKSAFVCTILLFWASDLFYLYVDQHAATIGRLVASWCWVKEQ